MEPLIDIISNCPLLSEVFGCFDSSQVETYLDTYKHHRLHFLSQKDSDRSVVLATAHFIQMHSVYNNSAIAASSRQSTKGSSVVPLQINNWESTTFGVEYSQLQRVSNMFASQAIGI